VNIDISEGRERTEQNLVLARRGERDVLFEEKGWLACAVYDRYKLPAGCVFTGPALVEERESTCIIGPGSKAHIDRSANLIIDIE
jgi:N-methylhydantoinase A